MSVLIFVAYSGSDPSGSPLGELTDAYDKTVGLEDNAVGNGSFSIHPDSVQAAWCAQGNYVRAYRDTFAPANLLGGFWIESGGDTVVSGGEEAGEALKRGGRGPIVILETCIVWHASKVGNYNPVQKAKSRWHWNDVHPATAFRRLLLEAQARNGLQGVTWDFNRKRDSDGVPFSSAAAKSVDIPIGITMLEVVQMMRDYDLHVSMDADLVIHVYDAYENDLSGSVAIALGSNIRDTSERSIAASRAKSHVLVQGTNKDDLQRYVVAYNDAARNLLGRRVESHFVYQRTATRAVLKRVGDRKLRKWIKQFDGPITVGTIDITGAVAVSDFTVGDTVYLNIPGIFVGAERVVGITLVETDGGEYDPIIDFGDFAHDPVTGAYMGGDSSSNPCGCLGEAPAPGVPGTTAEVEQQYDFDDYDRDGSASSYEVHQEYYPTATRHRLLLPDVPKATGDFIFAAIAYASQQTGTPGTVSYTPMLGQPSIEASDSNANASGTTHVIDIPDGTRGEDEMVVVVIAWTDQTEDLGANSGWDAYGFVEVAESVSAGSTLRSAVMAAPAAAMPTSGAQVSLTSSATMTSIARTTMLQGAHEVLAAVATTTTLPTLDPTASSFPSGMRAEWMTAAVSDAAVTGDPTGYTNDFDGSSGAAYLRTSEKMDDSASESPASYTISGTEQVLFTIWVGGQQPMTLGAGDATNAYVPIELWWREVDGDEGFVGVDDFLDLWLDSAAEVSAITGVVSGADGLEIGSSLLATNANYVTISDQTITGPPATGDNLFFVFGARGGAASTMSGDVRRQTAASPTPLGEVFGDWSAEFIQHSRIRSMTPHVLTTHRQSADTLEPGTGENYALEASVGNDTYGDGRSIVFGFFGSGGGSVSTSGGGDGSGLGRILSSNENGGSPWPGDNPYTWTRGANVSLGITGGALYAEASATANHDWLASVDAADGALPMANDVWEVEGRFRVTGASGSLSDAGERFLSLDFEYTGEIKLHLGDASRNPGISVTGATTDYQAAALPSLGSYSRFKWKWEQNYVYGKVWNEGDTEPDWMVNAELNQTPAVERVASEFDIVASPVYGPISSAQYEYPTMVFPANMKALVLVTQSQNNNAPSTVSASNSWDGHAFTEIHDYVNGWTRIAALFRDDFPPGLNSDIAIWTQEAFSSAGYWQLYAIASGQPMSAGGTEDFTSSIPQPARATIDALGVTSVMLGVMHGGNIDVAVADPLPNSTIYQKDSGKNAFWYSHDTSSASDFTAGSNDQITNPVALSAILLGPVAPSADLTGQLTIAGGVGNNGGTAMRSELDWLKATLVAGAGGVIKNKFVAYGDGATTKFFIDPFAPGTLIVSVDGIETQPIDVNADQGWFRLDRAPYGDPLTTNGSSIVTASYEKA